MNNLNENDHLKEINDQYPRNLPYYYDNINREKSEEILEKVNRPGCFLIRTHQSNSSCIFQSPYVLSLIDPQLKIRHFLLYKTNDKLFIKPYSNEFYSSIQDFVREHRVNPGLLPCPLLEYPIRFPSSLIIETNQLIRQEILGRGHFGIVYKGFYKNSPVAIKTYSSSCSLSSEECQINMLNEARTMMSLKHPYLVHLYGISSFENRFCLITEFITNGSLLLWLQQKEKLEFSLKSNLCSRLQLFSFQICDAMSYLESQSIIHRDLAARNCLIDDEANFVKVGDFGMAKFLSSSSLIYKGKCDTPFPLRWSSPEVLLYQEYSSKSDVWSFGILLWEIFSLGQMPFTDSTTNDMAAIRIKTGQMPTKPSLANESIFRDIILQCWIFKPDDRPSFSLLKESFNKIFQRSTPSAFR